MGKQLDPFGNRTDDRLIIFGMRESLKLLQNTENCFMDELFSIATPQLAQLYTDHGPSNGKKIKGAYCFLLIKKMETYETKYSRMEQVKISKGCLPQILLDLLYFTILEYFIPYVELFSQIHLLTNQVVTDSIMTDFKKSMIGTKTQVYKLILQKECFFFHLSKSNYCRVEELKAITSVFN